LVRGVLPSTLHQLPKQRRVLTFCGAMAACAWPPRNAHLEEDVDKVQGTTDTRGFAMRRGRRRALERMRDRSHHQAIGRHKYKRRAGGYRDRVRCSACKPGRRRGPGGAKALKKVAGRRRDVRDEWLALLSEAREAQGAVSANVDALAMDCLSDFVITITTKSLGDAVLTMLNTEPDNDFTQEITHLDDAGQQFCKSLKARFQAIIDPDVLGNQQQGAFKRLRKDFLWQNGRRICSALQECFPGPMQLRAAPLSSAVEERFLHATQHGGGVIRPALHGTSASNLSSIFQRGLLIPGNGNDLEIVHGAAHGTGIYTATLDKPLLAKGFSTNGSMLVCGVLDDARLGLHLSTRFACKSFGCRGCKSVRHVGDAMVISEEQRVAPLFVASRWVPQSAARGNKSRSDEREERIERQKAVKRARDNRRAARRLSRHLGSC